MVLEGRESPLGVDIRNGGGVRGRRQANQGSRKITRAPARGCPYYRRCGLPGSPIRKTPAPFDDGFSQNTPDTCRCRFIAHTAD